MGTSGSYSGSGGKIGDGLREGMGDWIDSIPSGPAQGGPDQNTPGGDQGTGPRLDPAVLLPVVSLLRPRSSGGGGDGPGGGAGVGGGAGGGGGAGSRAVIGFSLASAISPCPAPITTPVRTRRPSGTLTKSPARKAISAAAR